MAKPHPTFLKRQRERKNDQKRQEKVRKRAERKVESDQRKESLDLSGEDPDIAGIVPGPQPLLAEFRDDEDEPVESKETEGSK